MSNGASTVVAQQQQLQSNGKKNGSGGSSGGPTPAGTPVMNGTGQGFSPPPPNNAPKYGTLVPNRIFVGGISASTTEGELMQLFSAYGTVKAAKIIQDRAGVSKGYGFITFESEDDARRPLRDPDSIVLRERRLNIAPAIKKQPFGRPPAAPPYDVPPQDGRSPAPPPPTLQGPPPFFFGAAPPFYAGATAYYAPPVPPMVSSAQAQVSQAQNDQVAQQVYQAPPVYQTQAGPPQTAAYPSMMFPQTIYMPQQYPMMPYEYGMYGGGPHTNGVPQHFGPPPNSGGGSSPPRPCYAQPTDATILYGPPPPALFHTATTMDGPLYATDGFEMGHPAGGVMGHFPPGMPYGISEQDSFLEHPVHTMTSSLPPSASPERNSATPVVSILTLEQQQEKDPAAMQGGRRPVPLPSMPQRRGGGVPNVVRRTFIRPPPVMQAPPPASFVPPARRPRKVQRRPSSYAPPHEIGAGDAPLANPEDGLSAQVEALKI